jgi:hypothetical protein
MHMNRCRSFRAGRLLAAVAGLALAPLAVAAVFEDVTAAAGLSFTYDNGGTGEYYFPEIMGAGVALLDYDRDGRLDVYLVQAGALGPEASAEKRQSDRLYRNESERDAEGRWRPRFTDVTAEAGIDARGYGMGVAVGDYTGNGYPDLYVLNFGSNQLWRNNGDGTFADVTVEAGVDDPRWSVSGSFADLDGDGREDLVVANYVDFALESHRECRSATTSQQDYCSPSAYDGISDKLFVNRGDGRFDDVSESSGLAEVARHGLGVVSADFNDDGRLDIYVANDGSPNSLWINQGDMRFVDDAFLAGAAVNADGMTEAGMGVDAADYNRSGRDDLFVTHMRRESNTLYRNEGKGWFSDVTSAAGLGAVSLPETGFGTAWLDLDNDGWLDLAVANGAVVVEEDLVAAGDPFPYHQPNQLFANQGDGRFKEVTADSGPAFAVSRVSRGLAVGDLDNDGRADLVIANINSPARLLVNRSADRHHWLGLSLRAADGRVERTQAVAWLERGDDPPLRRRSRADGSYASANDARVLFGFGDRSGPVRVRVDWPDGQSERFDDLATDRYHTLRQGTGQGLP